MNNVVLTGRLTADPELRTTQSGISSCRFTIAVDRPYQKDKEKQADFFNIQTWRGTAEFVNKYFSKGKSIAVSGKLQNNNYTDNNGVKHYSVDIVAENVEFNGGKNDNPSDNHSAPVSYSPLPTATPQTAPSPAIEIGDIKDFEEILGDGEVPF